MVYVQAKDSVLLSMVINMWGSSSKGRCMVRVWKYIKMEIDIKVIGKIIKNLGKVSIPGLMVQDMRVSLNWIRKMDGEFSFGPMATNIRASGNKIKDVEMVCYSVQMARNIMGNGRMINPTDVELITGHKIADTKVNGITAKWMV